MLAAVLERTAELGVLRAIGASRLAVFRLVALEALLLSLLGGAAGLLLAAGGGRWVEAAVKRLRAAGSQPNSLLALTRDVMPRCLLRWHRRRPRWPAATRPGAPAASPRREALRASDE